MWLNNSAITKTKRVESMMSKLPHLIKKPSNTCFSSQIQTIVSSSCGPFHEPSQGSVGYGADTFPPILHGVLSVLGPDREEDPSPPLPRCLSDSRSPSGGVSGC